jgi:tetrahydromethanopterin S-methyltransferase subunit C
MSFNFIMGLCTAIFAATLTIAALNLDTMQSIIVGMIYGFIFGKIAAYLDSK